MTLISLLQVARHLFSIAASGIERAARQITRKKWASPLDLIKLVSNYLRPSRSSTDSWQRILNSEAEFEVSERLFSVAANLGIRKVRTPFHVCKMVIYFNNEQTPKRGKSKPSFPGAVVSAWKDRDVAWADPED